MLSSVDTTLTRDTFAARRPICQTELSELAVPVIVVFEAAL
jgi:hypothetical protein